MVSRNSKVDNFANSLSFFWLIIIRSGLLSEIRWSVCLSNSHGSLYVSFSRKDAWLWIYHLFIRWNLFLLLLVFWSFEDFWYQHLLIVSLRILSDSKSPQVSRTPPGIQADLNNAGVLMVSTCPLIPKYSSSSINPLVIVPRAPVTIGITDTYMFHSFSVPKQGLGTYISFRFLSLLLNGLTG